MNQLTGFQRDLLYGIAGKAKPSGQELKDELEYYYGSEINHGRLYPNLDALVDEGLVNKGQINRRTNYYELSDRGEATLRDRRTWENQQSQVLEDTSPPA